MSESDNISVKIVILGDPAVGKTTLRINFIGKSFGDKDANYLMTLGADLSEDTIEISDKITLNTQIWDIAGQDNFAPIIGEYLRGAQGAILVYDMTRSYTFDELTKWLDRLHEANPQMNKNIPFIVVGNKADLENFYDYDEDKVDEFISYLNRHELYSKTPVHHINTSAKTGFAVQEAFRTLGKTIIRNFLEQGDTIEGAEDLFEDISEITGQSTGQEEDTAPPIVEDEEERLVKPSEMLRRRREEEEKKKQSEALSKPEEIGRKQEEAIEKNTQVSSEDEISNDEQVGAIKEEVTEESREELREEPEKVENEQVDHVEDVEDTTFTIDHDKLAVDKDQVENEDAVEMTDDIEEQVSRSPDYSDSSSEGDIEHGIEPHQTDLQQSDEFLGQKDKEEIDPQTSVEDKVVSDETHTVTKQPMHTDALSENSSRMQTPEETVEKEQNETIETNDEEVDHNETDSQIEDHESIEDNQPTTTYETNTLETQVMENQEKNQKTTEINHEEIEINEGISEKEEMSEKQEKIEGTTFTTNVADAATSEENKSDNNVEEVVDDNSEKM